MARLPQVGGQACGAQRGWWRAQGPAPHRPQPPLPPGPSWGRCPPPAVFFLRGRCFCGSDVPLVTGPPAEDFQEGPRGYCAVGGGGGGKSRTPGGPQDAASTQAWLNLLGCRSSRGDKSPAMTVQPPLAGTIREPRLCVHMPSMRPKHSEGDLSTAWHGASSPVFAKQTPPGRRGAGRRR